MTMNYVYGESWLHREYFPDSEEGTKQYEKATELYDLFSERVQKRHENEAYWKERPTLRLLTTTGVDITCAATPGLALSTLLSLLCCPLQGPIPATCYIASQFSLFGSLCSIANHSSRIVSRCIHPVPVKTIREDISLKSAEKIKLFIETSIKDGDHIEGDEDEVINRITSSVKYYKQIPYFYSHHQEPILRVVFRQLSHLGYNYSISNDYNDIIEKVDELSNLSEDLDTAQLVLDISTLCLALFSKLKVNIKGCEDLSETDNFDVYQKKVNFVQLVKKEIDCLSKDDEPTHTKVLNFWIKEFEGSVSSKYGPEYLI